jgi:molybdopterin synthase catalytic subunit
MILFQFVEGAVDDNLLKQNNNLGYAIGATAIFKGTVRADGRNNKYVDSIEFTAHEKIATKICIQLMENYEQKYSLHSITIFHSLGKIYAGETCFVVIIESAHRKEAFELLTLLVDDFKKNVPVYGKEFFTDGSYVWKENNYNQ